MFSRQTLYDANKKIWSGRKVKEIFNPKVTIGELIRFSLLRNPNAIGQISDNSGASFTNAEILLRSLKIGQFIQNSNFQLGDVVGIVARNTENLAPLVFGLVFCGVTTNTLDVSFSVDEIVNIFQHTKPNAVFCDADVYETVQQALNTLQNNARIYTVRGKFDDSVMSIKDILETVSDEQAKEFEPNEPEDGRNHTAIILCSSGTTGSHKGVCLSHAAILQGVQALNISSSNVILCFSSLYWLSGCGTLFVGTISGVTRLITDEPFNPKLFLRLVEQYKVTHFLSPPSQLAMILEFPDIDNYDLSSIVDNMCGGSFVPQILVDKMQDHLPNGQVSIGYGLTEMGMVANFNSNPRKYGSVGRTGSNIQLKILSEHGVPLGPNQDGEICYKPLYTFSGYSGRPEDTKTILDEDGWIHTGDIGHIDDDGFLFYVARKKEIMKYFNFHFSPIEIENVLLNMTEIAQVSVCGIPDPIATDLPAALIVRKAQSKSLLSEDEVYAFAKKNLSSNKQLRGGVYFVDELPMTPSGKVQRRKVQEICIRLSGKGESAEINSI